MCPSLERRVSRAQSPGCARLLRIVLLFTLTAVLPVLFPSATFAIPAWSQKYDVPCSMCHYPAPRNGIPAGR